MNAYAPIRYVFAVALLFVASAGISQSTSDTANAPAQKTEMPQDSTQTTQAPKNLYEWSSNKKNDTVSIAAISQNGHMDIYFNNHVFGHFAFRSDAPLPMKVQTENWYRAAFSNKIMVQVAIDDEAPTTQKWMVVNTDDKKGPGLISQGDQEKLYKQMLKSKKLTITFPNAKGENVVMVFDLTAMNPEMALHKEKASKSSAWSVLGGLTAF